MKNRIEDLRNHLFAAIEGLMDEEKPMDIERAKAVADLAQVAINSAKVEVDFLKVTAEKPVTRTSGFFEKAPTLPAIGGGSAVENNDTRSKGGL